MGMTSSELHRAHYRAWLSSGCQVAARGQDSRVHSRWVVGTTEGMSQTTVNTLMYGQVFHSNVLA
jgi:hypothetical protein